MSENEIELDTWADEYEILTEALPFDRLKAPEELEQASQLVDKAGERTCDASKQYNRIKMLLETKEAEVGIALRREAEEKKEKMTEKSLDERITTHPDVVALKLAKIEAEDIKNRWQNRKISLESRGRDLHDEVALITCGFARN